MLVACGSSAVDGSSGGGGNTSTGTGTGGSTTSTSTSTSAGTCALAADTTQTSDVAPSGCHVLDRDASACADARKAQGLTGFWLEFSCRVLLSATTENGQMVVKAASDGQPDYPSNYFAASDPCHESYTGAIQNPNQIVAKNYVIELPLVSDQASQKMMTAIVGLAVNGVPIFGDFAAPGDDIYQEAKTFDRCGGHPQMSGVYHYHSEPLAISYDDDKFIGVMRDGYPIYGRKDADGSYPTVDAFGGHTGTTPHSPTAAVYHYHVNQQTSANPGTAGQMQWFLTTGSYRGTPAPCGSCN